MHQQDNCQGKFKILHCLNNATAIILQMHMIHNVVIRNYLGKPQHLPMHTLKLLLDKNGTQQHMHNPTCVYCISY